MLYQSDLLARACRENVTGDVVDVQEFFGKFSNQVTLGNFRHAKGRDHTGDVVLYDGLGDLLSQIPRQGNVGMLKTEHHDRQTLSLPCLASLSPQQTSIGSKTTKRTITIKQTLLFHLKLFEPTY